MRFVQTIAYSTTRPDDMKALSDQFQADNPEPGPGVVGIKVLKDRDHENRYMIVAEFESYELAMENSAKPETDAFAKKMGELTEGEVTYGNYDVIDEMG